MRIHTMPKDFFDQMLRSKNITEHNVHQRKECFISINDTLTDDKPYFRKSLDNVLVLHFDDVPYDVPSGKKDENGNTIIAKAMTSSQAKQIIDFIDKNRNKTRCIVHCTAGVSRSGSVAVWINRFLGQDWPEFRHENKHIIECRAILETLDNALNGKGVF